MKRISYWLMSTVTAVVLMFGYHTSTSGAVSSTGAGITSSADAGTDGDSSASGVSGTFTGATVDTQWGPVQVEITVADGDITDVSVVQYPADNPRDIEINNYALPVLVDATVEAQSADIDMVSGATVTSQGYVESLQSALDQAGM